MAGLDPESRFQFKRIMKDLGSRGISIFFSSHILSDVQDVADTIGILKGGKLAFSGSFDDLRSRFGAGNDVEVLLSRDNGGWKDLVTDGILEIEPIGGGRILARLDPNADQDEAIDSLIKGLIRSGCRIRILNPVSPDLEELYVKFVGGDRR
jgi:ABC-2 type transport system ATP-binding protein